MLNRIAMLLSLILLASQGFSQENKPGKWCSPNSVYENSHQGNISELRISLLNISEISKTKNGKSIQPFLTDIADASVFSLANILSLRADFNQNCTRKEGDYHNGMESNERFIMLLNMAIGESQYFSLQMKLWNEQEKHPELFFECGHGCIGLKEGHGGFFKFNKEITERLELWEKRGENLKNPVTVAARLLLGKETEWSEQTLAPIETFKLGNQGEILNDIDTAELFKWLRKTSTTKIIIALTSYYLKP